MVQHGDELGGQDLGGHVAMRLAARNGDFRSAMTLAATTGIVMAQSNAWLKFVEKVAEAVSGEYEPTVASTLATAFVFTVMGTACVWSLQFF